mmetsp:Transcript_61162/g.115338  ORF Transcript_61162/g.115338 Transcript_61162/m.115338 type:complete len:616 (-) Transcript_61162:36-1883(-)
MAAAESPKGSARKSARGSMKAPPSEAAVLQAEEQAKARLSQAQPGTAPMTAFLLEAAEVETRLRQHILELIEPCIRKQGILEGRVKEVNAYINATQDELQELKKLSSGAEGLYSMVENFRVELSGWDKERHEHEQKVGDRLSLQEIEINGLRQSLEAVKGADHGTIQRTLKNLGDMLATYKDENTDLRRFCVERMDLNRDKLAKLRDEFETRTMILENQMHHLQDMQTTTNTNVTHMEDIVQRMDRRVDSNNSGINDLWRSKASVTCVEEQQQDLTEFMRHVNSVVSSLKQQFGSLVDDVKGHFETATKIVGQSTSFQIDAMRHKYEEDVQRIDGVRRDIEEFVQVQSKAHEQLEQDLMGLRQTILFGGADLPKVAASPQNSSEEPDADAEASVSLPDDGNWGLSQLRRSIDNLERQRDIDSKNLQVELMSMKKRSHDHEAQLADHNTSINYRSTVISTLVDSALMGLALELQDDQDRKGIALFGIRDATQKGASVNLPDINKSRTNPVLRASTVTPRRRLTQKSPEGPLSTVNTPRTESSAAPEHEAVLSLDTRCLSCSGSGHTVLAGFKMACLQYAPGPVEWERTNYDRSELIHKRIQLLQQAKVLNATRSVD